MIPDIALPGPTDPDKPVIAFVQIECRCGQRSPVVAADPMADNIPNSADDWHNAHFDATDHRRFYRWRLERGAGSIFRL